MRKALKITGISLLVIVILLAASPFLFKEKLESLLKKTINNNLNAQVEWESLDLSLLRSFPDATITLSDFTVINNAPFLGDTLAQGQRFQIEMGITQLFKNAQEDPIKLDALVLDKAAVNIKIDKEGNANYDIAKESADTEGSTSSDPFVFNLNHYELNDTQIAYTDLTTNTFFELSEVNHEGSGNFSAIEGDLDTETEGLISLTYDGINYFEKHRLRLDALFHIHLEDQKYTFKENSGFINELPLNFDGYLQLLDEGTDMDITFQTPDSDFKNFLAVIPATYRSNLDGVETTGDFRIGGLIKGKATDTTIPLLDITINSTNASFKYPSLQKRMNNINIDVKIKNDTGIADLTYIEINDLQFMIDNDAFKVNGSLNNLTGNTLINLAMKGAINLENIEKVYPLDLESPLTGRVVADFTTRFDMNSIEKQQYQNIKNTGMASLSGFNYKTSQLPNPISISKAEVSFKPGTIGLNAFNATSGSSDISATGTIENLIPFVMSKEDLKGIFNVTSTRFDLNDFSVTETSSGSNSTNATATTEESIQIPDFLDATLNFKAATAIYDNLELTNTSGRITIENEEATLSNLKSTIFGGNAGISGSLTTRGGTPSFDMSVDLSSIDINRSFQGLDMMQGLAPIAKALQGALNTKINLKGKLDGSLSPILSSVSGNAFAEILTASVDASKTPLLNLLDEKVNFIQLKDINLEKLKANLTFSDGKVQIKPFDLEVKDVTINISGGHSFSNEMNYKLDLDVPASYLGSDISSLLSTLTAAEKKNLTVGLPVALSGSFTTPKVDLNLKTATTALTNQIIDIQKQRVKDKVQGTLTDALGGLLGGSNGTTTTTSQDNSTTTPTTPSTTTQSTIKNAATDILGGIFGKKKKTTEVQKDSVN